MSTTIRTATPADLPAITEIYNEAGVGTTASYDLEPVSLDNRRAWFEAHQRDEYPVLVAVRDDEVLGFGAYGRFRAKAGYDATVEHSVYVHQDSRGTGVGSLLMRALIDMARGQGHHVMIGVLDGDNHASVAFHQSLGFHEVGRLPQVARKFGRWLDAVFVQLMLDSPRASGERAASSPQ